MLIRKLLQFDSDKFYVGDVIQKIPQSVDEAELLGLPVDRMTGQYAIPPIPPDCLEVDNVAGLHRIKREGDRIVEGLTLEELAVATKPSPNWQGLTALSNTALFKKGVATSNKNAWALLLFTISTSHNEANLYDAIRGVIQGMKEKFVEDDIAQINAVLDINYFDPI